MTCNKDTDLKTELEKLAEITAGMSRQALIVLVDRAMDLAERYPKKNVPCQVLRFPTRKT